jgi:hypothetical protein
MKTPTCLRYSVRYMLIVSARSQFALLMDMYSKGIITGRTGEDESSDALTDGQLLFRLQDFYGAGQDAIEINDHEYAQECTDVVSIIREVIESRKKLKAAEKQIAELERDETQLSVPDDVMAAIQKVARIRLDLNDFDGDKRGIAESLGEEEEALIEVVNRRAAMLQRGKS